MDSRPRPRIGRRQFLRTAGAGVAAAAIFPSAITRRVMAAGERCLPPNLVILHTDQQTPWTVSSYPRLPGDWITVTTPHINSVGERGVRVGSGSYRCELKTGDTRSARLLVCVR